MASATRLGRFLLVGSLSALACSAPNTPGDATSGDVTATSDTPRPPTDTPAPPMDAQPSDAPTVDAPAPPSDAPAADVPPDVPSPPVDTCRGTAETAVFADPRLCLVRFADSVPTARGLAVAPDGDLFVVSNGSVVTLRDGDGDGVVSMAERTTWDSVSGLNHGLAFSRDNAFVYASSQTTVYRWPYTAGQRTAMGAAQTVISNMPTGTHNTRSLAFDAMGRLYVSVGSDGNLDLSAAGQRALVRRFALPATLPAGGVAFSAGEIVAEGLRNEAALTVDSAGRVWGAENGMDDIGMRLPGFPTDNNPVEELNLLSGAGARFFGYPSCFTEGVAGGGGAMTQRVDPGGAMGRNDAWCQNTANNHPPIFGMQAHWAPLGITEYTGTALPAAWRGDLFVAAHGSWDHSTGVGRLIARLDVLADGSVMAATPIVSAIGGTSVPFGNRPRPVDIETGADGALYFTTDSPGRVYRIGYR